MKIMDINNLVISLFEYSPTSSDTYDNFDSQGIMQKDTPEQERSPISNNSKKNKFFIKRSKSSQTMQDYDDDEKHLLKCRITPDID